VLSIFRVFVLAIYFLKHQILVDYDVSGNKTIISGFGLVHVSDLSDHGYPGQHHRKGCGVALEKHAVCRNRELFANRQKRHQAGSGIYFCAFSDSGRKKASGRGP